MKIYRIIFFIALLSFVNNTLGQADSLIRNLSSSNDSIVSSSYLNLIKYYRNSKIDSAVYYLDKLGLYINKLKSKNYDTLKLRYLIINMNTQKGNNFLRIQAFDSAEYYYNKSLTMNKQLKDAHGQAFIYNNLGILYEKQSKYTKALSYYIKQMNLCDSISDYRVLAKAYLNIGLLYYRQHQFKDALNYYQKSLALKKQLNDKRGIALVYNNIGIVYYYLNNPDKVIKYFKLSLKTYEELGDLRLQALPLFNIAELYGEQNKLKQALIYYKKSYKIEQQLKDNAGQAESLSAIADTYSAMKQYSKAIKTHKKSIEICKKISAPRELSESILSLSNTYQKIGDYKNALIYYKQYKTIQDSIFNLKRSKQLEQIKEKYESDKKDREIKILSQDKELSKLKIERQTLKMESQNKVILLGLIILILVLLGLVIAYRMFKNEKYSNQMLQFKNESIERKNNQIQRTLHQLNRALKTRELFLANTTHELRTPLNIINGFTNLILNSKIDDSQKYYLHQIKDSTLQLLHLIEDVLTLTKIESGNLNIVRESVTFNKLLNSVASGFADIANQKGIEYSFNFDGNKQTILEIDPIRIRQVISNLIDNAIKFTPKKSSVTVECNYLASKTLQIIVADSGVGISDEEKEKIFESFYQTKNNSTPQSTGTGLGLNIVKQIIELHGGTITVKNNTPQGTVFIVEVPAQESQNETFTFSYDSEIKKSDTISFGRILLAEDNIVNSELTIDILSSYNPGLIIDVAQNGQEAVQRLQRNTYDLLIVDLRMPILNGLEVAEAVRNTFPDKKKNIPIIAISAQPRDSEKQKCAEQGINGFVSKPYEPIQLINEIERVSNFKKINKLNTQSTDSNNPLLTKIYLGNSAKLKKIIEIALNAIPKQLEMINNSIRNKDWHNVVAHAHKAKTSFGYLSEEKVIEYLDDIESNANSIKDFENMGAMFEKIYNRWIIVKGEVTKILAQDI